MASVFASTCVVLRQQLDSQSSAAVCALRADIQSSKNREDSAEEAVCMTEVPFSRKILSDVF